MGVSWADDLVLKWKSFRSAGNRARANWAIGLSSTVAANLAATNVKDGRSQASRQLQQQPCFSLTGFFCARCFSKLGGRRPPTAVVGMGARCGEGRGPAPNTGCPADALACFFWGPAGPKLRVEFLLEFATCATSQNALIPYVENVVAVAGGKSWGSAGPTSRGVTQLGNTLGVLS